MAGVPGIPQNLIVQSANGEILVSWDLSTGATSYTVQRSEDNITFATVATVTGSPLATEYLDDLPTIGTQYWYKVCATNASGDSPYTNSDSEVATLGGEMTLGQIRLQSQQNADRVNSQFVTKKEWNNFIKLAMYELYDLIIDTFEDYYNAQPIQFYTDGSTYVYPLPTGRTEFQDGLNPQLTITAKPFYKLLGIDLGLQTASNAYVTINKFNFIDRNRFVYPNTSSTIYGVFNMQYRVMGSNIEFIPTPSANQPIRVWYIPRLTELLRDTDITDNMSISGWMRYVIVRASKYALDKEESDTTKQDQELMYLKNRIEETAANRDAGQPDTISDTRNAYNGWGRQGFGGNGSGGGF